MTLKKSQTAISNALGIEYKKEIIDVTPEETPQQVAVTTVSVEDEQEDYDFARKTIKEVVEKGTKALDDAISLAQDYEKPSGYDAVANMIKALTDSAKQLHTIHKDRPITQNSIGNNFNVEKAVFVGSPKDLVKALKEDGKQ